MLTHACAVPPPLAIDDEFLSDRIAETLHEQNESQMGFFIQSIGLFEILNDILTTLYVHDSGSESPRERKCLSQERLQTMMRLNSALDQFWRKVPPYLTAQTTEMRPRKECFVLQSNVLLCR